MLHIFHGDNSEPSRKSFIELIAKLKVNGANEVVRLNGDDLVKSDLIQALESQSLFGGDRIVAIEGLLSRRPSKEKDSLLSYLSLSPCHLAFRTSFGEVLIIGSPQYSIKSWDLASRLPWDREA